RVFGVEQGWSMFTPNMARGCSFLAAEIEFRDDNDTYLVKSPNEPAFSKGEQPVPQTFLRVGGWRQRKYEDSLAFTKPDQLERMDASDGDDLFLFEAYVRWSIRRWREKEPDDKRTPSRVRLLRRRFSFPREIGSDPLRSESYDRMEVWTIGYFNPDGT